MVTQSSHQAQVAVLLDRVAVWSTIYPCLGEIDKWPADYWSMARAHFPNAGILGAPDYTGGWTAEVDFVTGT